MRKLSTPCYFRVLLPLLLLFASMGAGAQVQISIGTGTAGNGATTYPAPIQDRYEGSRAQYLYRASELTAAGMTAGFISNIKFVVSNLNGADIVENYTIKLGTTTTASLSATAWESGTSVVYGPVDY